MKKLFFSLILVLMIFSYANVKALNTCDTSELTRLKELATNVQFNANTFVMGEDVEGETADFVYDIGILNYDKSLRITYKSNEDPTVSTVDSNLSKVEGLTPGDRVTFYIYAYTANLCVDELLRTVTVDLPVPNEYYYFHKDKCKEYPDFKYCKEYMKIDSDFSDIDKEFQEYIKDKNKIIKVSKSNAIWYILGGSLIGLAAISFVLVINFKKKKEKDDL